MCECKTNKCSCNTKKNCIPLEIQQFISCGEKILFEGYYDNALSNNQNNLSTIPCDISANKCGYNVEVIQYYYVNDTNQSNLRLLYETYTLSSYNKMCNNVLTNKKTGQITWNGFYPDAGTGGNTTATIQQFVVLGGDGIYSKVKKVIIDFRNTIRKIYFVGKK